MKQSKRGFTIVELVIVIAVIAVLAAVLIPTFSSLIKKANLSADMQNVRAMTLALKAEESKTGAKPKDIETVKAILANAGFNTENWQTLYKKGKVFWYEKTNEMILYDTDKHQVVYPDTIAPDIFLDVNEAKLMHEYDENHLRAEALDTSLGNSTTGGKSKTQLVSEATTDSEKTAIESVDALVQDNSAIRSALGLGEGDTAYINASKELREGSASTYAAMQIMSIDKTQVVNAGDITANVFYISVNTAENATSVEMEAAQKAASEYVYSVFTQINSGKLQDSVSIVMPAGTTIDASAHEWAPAKHFTGYFGTDNAAQPIVINGATLTKATGYNQTMVFDGSGGKYFVTGFWGVVYGETTIENVTFRGLTMNEPGSNFDMTLTNLQHSRNSIGIVGGVVDDPNPGTTGSSITNVVLRNITVDNDVRIQSAATAAGLVGYVGASGETDTVNKNTVKRRLYNGTLLIENCHVSATVIGGEESGSYGPCGGLVGFACRVQEDTGRDADGVNSERYNVIIKDCVFDGKVSGWQGVGAAVGDFQSGSLFFFQGTNDFTGATVTSVDTHGTNWVGLIGSDNGGGIVYFSTADEIKVPSGMAAIGAREINKVRTRIDAYNDIDTRPAAQKFDTVKDKAGNNIGGNNGRIA